MATINRLVVCRSNETEIGGEGKSDTASLVKTTQVESFRAKLPDAWCSHSNNGGFIYVMNGGNIYWRLSVNAWRKTCRLAEGDSFSPTSQKSTARSDKSISLSYWIRRNSWLTIMTTSSPTDRTSMGNWASGTTQRIPPRKV